MYQSVRINQPSSCSPSHSFHQTSISGNNNNKMSASKFLNFISSFSTSFPTAKNTASTPLSSSFLSPTLSAASPSISKAVHQTSRRITRARWGDSILSAQHALLDHHSNSPISSFRWNCKPVKLSNGHIINLVIVHQSGMNKIMNKHKIEENNDATLTLIHGWGAGLGHFAHSLPYLTPHFRAIYLVDLPGMAASSRPHFPTHCYTSSLNYFLDDLTEFHSKLQSKDSIFKQSKKYIAAHSLGGYITAEWIMRYQQQQKQQHVIKKSKSNNLYDKLFLVSPVGLPKRPSSSSSSSLFSNTLSTSIMNIAWSAGITPQDALRVMPDFIARDLCARYVRSRFMTSPKKGICTMPIKEQRLLSEYCFQISVAPAASERAIASILSPGAWAVSPLVDRLHHLRLPCTFMYGDRDWMDWTAAEGVRKDMSMPTRLVRVEDSDHNIFIDNAKGFANEVVRAKIDFEKGLFT